eukprot:1158981-Pelagomonas_calceolata.AAC.4
MEGWRPCKTRKPENNYIGLWTPVGRIIASHLLKPYDPLPTTQKLSHTLHGRALPLGPFLPFIGQQWCVCVCLCVAVSGCVTPSLLLQGVALALHLLLIGFFSCTLTLGFGCGAFHGLCLKTEVPRTEKMLDFDVVNHNVHYVPRFLQRDIAR